MNYNEYQALREQNIHLFLGDNPKFKDILLLGEKQLKSTMLAAAEWTTNDAGEIFLWHQSHCDGSFVFQEFTQRETLQIIAFCAAELARIG